MVCDQPKLQLALSNNYLTFSETQLEKYSDIACDKEANKMIKREVSSITRLYLIHTCRL